jgi:hypothetical protein
VRPEHVAVLLLGMTAALGAEAWRASRSMADHAASWGLLVACSSVLWLLGMLGAYAALLAWAEATAPV